MKNTNSKFSYGKRIIWHECGHILDHERRENRRKKEQIRTMGRLLTGVTDDSFRASEIIETFNEMKAEQRKLLAMRYWYGISIEELAEMYGVSDSAIYHRLARYRKEFRKLWEEAGKDD